MPPHPLSYARPPERCTCRHARLRPCYNLKNALLLLGSGISAILVSDVLPFEWKCRNCFGKRRLSADESAGEPERRIPMMKTPLLLLLTAFLAATGVSTTQPADDQPATEPAAPVDEGQEWELVLPAARDVPWIRIELPHDQDAIELQFTESEEFYRQAEIEYLLTALSDLRLTQFDAEDRDPLKEIPRTVKIDIPWGMRSRTWIFIDSSGYVAIATRGFGDDIYRDLPPEHAERFVALATSMHDFAKVRRANMPWRRQEADGRAATRGLPARARDSWTAEEC